ncbi:uncharacterized protein F4812DRAFT_425999 [Daldinia caldariorum]|uniref:uncharacterized protein n=1 Tax=Daldinia caldariorum TaxID=326644 RepID=UPI00200847BF|nr:uncharacterized protein F4812DRAFT_425999 [Daldinia caldariorum]KAI1468231.1 hypothetical protein F4812DRAFT_425999 [Daldinia caldariorum]
MASSTALPAALLIIYIIVSPSLIYIVKKHGLKHGTFIGWLFLFLFCTLKIVASAIEIHDARSSSAALVASIGLSPLLAAACGIMHESRVYILPKSRRPFDTQYLVLFHGLVTTAIALVASGASKLNNTTLSPDQLKRSLNLVKGGMILLLLGWLSLAVVTLTTYGNSLTQRSRRLAAGESGKALLLAVAISIPFLGIRLLERAVYFFTQNQDLSPVTGSLGLRIGFEVIEEIIVTLVFVFTGILTRNIRMIAAEDSF